MHEPLHLGSAEDDYGRNLVVQYTDGEGSTRLTTFYNYIEAVLIEKTIKQRQYFWFSGKRSFLSLLPPSSTLGVQATPPVNSRQDRTYQPMCIRVVIYMCGYIHGGDEDT